MKAHARLVVWVAFAFGLSVDQARASGNRAVDGLYNLDPIDAYNQAIRYEVHDAAERGNLDAVKRYVGRGGDLNATGMHGNPILMHAAVGGRSNVVRYLVERGADIDLTNKNRHNEYHLLYYVVKNGWTHVLRQMQRKEHFNLRWVRVLPKGERLGKDQLMFIAVANGQVAMARFLRRQGLSLKATNAFTGDGLVHVASAHGDLGMVRFLIENKASIRARNKNGEEPIHIAAHNGNLDMAKLLVLGKASIRARDLDGVQAIHIAAHHGNLNMVKFLVENGASVRSKTFKDKNTPLHLAASKGHLEVADYLISKRANPNPFNKAGQIPSELHLKFLGGKIDEAYIAYWANHKGFLYTLDDKGRSFLAKLVVHSSFEFFERMAKKGFSVRRKDHDSNTLVHLVLQHRTNRDTAMKFLRYLVEERKLSLTNRNAYGKQPIHYAYKNEDLEVLAFLVGRGADPNSRILGIRKDLRRHAQTLRQYKKVNRMVRDLGPERRPTLREFFPYLDALRSGRPFEFDLIDPEDYNEDIGQLLLPPRPGNRMPSEKTKQAPQNTTSRPTWNALNEDNYKEDEFDNGNQLIHIASLQGQVEVVRHLIEKHNINVNVINKQGETPLSLLSQFGEVDDKVYAMVRYLVEKGAWVNFWRYRLPGGNTILHNFINYGKGEHANDTIEYLLERKANIVAKNYNGMSPLRLAVAKGNAEVLGMLVERNARAYNLLLVAVTNQQTEMVRMLLDAGVRTDIQGLEEKIPLMYALEMKHRDISTMLINAMIRGFDKGYYPNGNTLVHELASQTPTSMGMELVMLTNDSSSFVQSKVETNWGWNFQTEMVRLLHEKGTRLDLRNHHRQLPVHLAARSGNIPLLSYLADHVGVAGKDKQGKDALYHAIASAHKVGSKLRNELITFGYTRGQVNRAVDHRLKAYSETLSFLVGTKSFGRSSISKALILSGRLRLPNLRKQLLNDLRRLEEAKQPQ